MAGKLEARVERGGLRHYLEGQPVHCGELLEMERQGRWVLGRYERSGSLAGLLIQQDEVIMLSESDIFRWPEPQLPRYRPS